MSATTDRNIMSGYSLKVRQLTDDDLRFTHDVDFGENDPNDCVAVLPADLGECLGAIVNLRTGDVIWSDADAQGTPLSDDQAKAFGIALRVVIESLMRDVLPL